LRPPSDSGCFVPTTPSARGSTGPGQQYLAQRRLAQLPRDGHVAVAAKAADVLQEPVQKTACAHALSDRRHRFVNDIGLTISVRLLGQTQIQLPIHFESAEHAPTRSNHLLRKGVTTSDPVQRMPPYIFKCLIQSLQRNGSTIGLADRLKCGTVKLFSDLARGRKAVIKIED
jgi:hypothetical protein